MAKSGNALMTKSVTHLGLGAARSTGGRSDFWNRPVSLPKKEFRGGEAKVSALVVSLSGRLPARVRAGMGIVYVAVG